jgi:hypothetical protein
MSGLIFFIVIATSIWVGFDSYSLLKQIPKDKRKALSSGASSASVWTLGCLLLWIIVFPWYLSARSKYKNYLQGKISQTVPSKVSVKYCWNCGAQYQGEPIFCQNCGTKLKG